MLEYPDGEPVVRIVPVEVEGKILIAVRGVVVQIVAVVRVRGRHRSRIAPAVTARVKKRDEIRVCGGRGSPEITGNGTQREVQKEMPTLEKARGAAKL